jgi:cytochrome P450
MLRDPRISHSFPDEYVTASVGDGPTNELLGRALTSYEPPEHTRLRRLIGAAFSPGLVRSLAADIEALVDELLAPALDRGRLDVVSELAFPLAVTLTGRLMGLPRHDWARMPRATAMANSAAPFVFPEDSGSTAADTGVAWLRRRVAETVEERRRAPGDDLVSRMLAAGEDGDRLTDEEIVDNAVLTFFAGFETSVSLIATGFLALLEHPGELARLRADPALLPTAVEEFLRYDTSIHGSPRFVRADVDVGGRTIRAGRVVMLMLASANHDETVFTDPARLDVGRRPNPHVSFGGGPHYCLGAALSRVEAQVVFGRLLARVAAMEVDGVVVRPPSASFRTFTSLPVSLKPA